MLKLETSYFEEISLTLLHPVFAHDEYHVFCLLQENGGNDTVFISSHSIRWFMILMFSIADHAYLTSALRWEFPGLSTVKLLFSLCN